MRLLVGVQARTNSQRLPKKIYEKIGPRTLLQWVYSTAEAAATRIRNEGDACDVYVLGPKNDTELRSYCLSNKIQGLFPDCAESDLISRYLLASEEYTHVIRITADCWNLQPDFIFETATLLRKDTCHYASNTIIRTFPEGQDVQGASRKAWQWLSSEATTDKEREHPWCEFDQNERERLKFKKEIGDISQLVDPNATFMIKMSIDTKEELELARKAYDEAERVKNAERLNVRRIKP